MKIYNFDDCKQNNRAYGGLSGQKLGIFFEGDNYLLKFPNSTRDSKGNKLKNVALSYSNGPVCEYIGSHIYEILGVNVHKTLLGVRAGKTVVACKDFVPAMSQLVEFGKIKTTFEEFLDRGSNGQGSELSEVLLVINKHPFFKRLPMAKDRFWDMFVIDAFIGNGDRNNGNWGLLHDMAKDSFSLAPVYDNGGCLNNKWDDEKMKNCLSDNSSLIAQAYNGVTCTFEKNGERMNPFHYFTRKPNADCINAINRIVPRIKSKKSKIFELFDNNPLLSDTQKIFYKKILSVRLDKALLPVYNKAQELVFSR